MAVEKKLDESTLFSKWRQTGDKVYFNSLYESMKPLIESAAQKASFGSNLPQSAHRIYAAQNMLEALKTYDPAKGVALQTHVYGSVHQKAKRLNYLYQNLGKITEPRAMMVGNYQTEFANLREDLGREPSTVEMADRMGLGLKDIERMQKEIHKDLSLTGLEEEIVVETPKEAEILDYIYYELNNDQKVIYDYAFGKHGKPKLWKSSGKINFEEIANRVGFSQSKVRLLFTQIKNKFEQAVK
jgi:DNA-directed RNA polymerase specialized sigma subunit